MVKKQIPDDPGNFPQTPASPSAEDFVPGTEKTELLISSPWTRSPKRMLFRDRVEQSLTRGTAQKGCIFALLYVDLDRFKIVNDSLGREAGNQLLREVGHRLQRCLRQGDAMTRLREDEYMILLENVHQLSDAVQVVEKIRRVLRSPFNLAGQNVFVTASVGIALGPAGYSAPEEIVRDAESAMHRAKTQGPGSFEIFNNSIHEQAIRLLKLETELRGAIDQHELRLQYQPIVSLETERIAGFEALLRWLHPQRGTVYPDEFVRTAEETGLIVPITQWALQEACRQIKKWQTRFPDFSSAWLSVNLSPKYFQKVDFGQALSICVAESGIDASTLILEITESQFLENADYLRSGFKSLNESGIKLWIDDFGSGYSSLGYLANFPIHSLKIDRSFIERLPSDSKSTAITKAILSLGKNLGINVIAEGIENYEQLEFLRSVECPYGQGFYFAKAQEAEVVESLLVGKPHWGSQHRMTQEHP
ncbi:MAG: hypothetical protein A3J28_13095 [Acidobacteria bacterium RIFCSPLOWO2_12_FULL_60_22]|nr:MAG: hypothetical protein A3J28_13095 [Acidobacteria bacterium RIFCSPLOWO2_12_FULL_60_22]